MSTANTLLEPAFARYQLEDRCQTDKVVTLGSIKLGLEGNDVILKSGETFLKVSPKALTSVRDTTGINFRGLDEYESDPELLKAMIQHSLNKRKENEVRLVSSKDALTELLSAKDAYISPLGIFDIVAEQLGSKLQHVESVRYDRKDRTSIRFVTDLAKQPPKRLDDMSHAGVWVRNGKGETEISAYVLRMVCTNGMMREREVAATLTNDVMRESIINNIQKALNNADKLLTSFVDLAEVRAPQPAAFLTHLVTHNRGSDRHVRQLMEQLPSLGDNTSAYDIVNLVTTQTKAKGDEAFEWLGATAVAEFQHSTCTHCARKL